MPRIETRDRFGKFNIPKWTAEVEVEIRRVYDRAVIAFVKATSTKIPVLTGQTRAALVGAAESLGLDPGISYTAAPVSSGDKEYAESRGNTIERGKTLGRAQLKITQKQGTFRINLEVTEAKSNYPYYARWEERWQSLQEGRSALKEVIETEFRVPEIDIDG